jgi:hypothetical protein
VRGLVERTGVEFPILIDPTHWLGKELGFRIVPSGFFLDAEGEIRYRHVDDLDLADPRVVWNLDRFLAGEPTESPEERAPMGPEALELFAQGVELYETSPEEAVGLWRRALEHDPDNLLIRSQIWLAEHPERFYPVVDREWQELQLSRETRGR